METGRTAFSQFSDCENFASVIPGVNCKYRFQFLTAQVLRHLLLMQKVRSSNPELIKSPTRCQRLAIAATLMCVLWRKATELGTAHSWHPKGY